MEGVLGVDAEVRALTQETQIEIKDLDELMGKEEVAEALATALGVPSLTAAVVKPNRQAHGVTQTAVVSLSADLAKKAIEIGKVKIRWVVCRSREKTVVARCFRCWDFGHLAQSRKGADRSKNCHKRGEEGHLAK